MKQLLMNIGNGDIDTVIVKDLSRFGREYLTVGRYLEEFFSLIGVRFISVNDGYDSIQKSSPADLSILVNYAVGDSTQFRVPFRGFYENQDYEYKTTVSSRYFFGYAGFHGAAAEDYTEHYFNEDHERIKEEYCVYGPVQALEVTSPASSAWNAQHSRPLTLSQRTTYSYYKIYLSSQDDPISTGLPTSITVTDYDTPSGSSRASTYGYSYNTNGQVLTYMAPNGQVTTNAYGAYD